LIVNLVSAWYEVQQGVFSPLNIAREDKATGLKNTRDQNATMGKGFGSMWLEMMILFVALSMPFVDPYFVVLPADV
jgi:hypothetical protein